MKIEHLEKRIIDYKKSIEIVIEKKLLWNTKTKSLLLKVLNKITSNYDIGWRVQELNWISTNEAINITFDSFPSELMSITNKIPEYQFIKGAALVFSQAYNGDIYILILFPIVENISIEKSSIDLGIYNPTKISEELIVEKVDEFLKEMIEWELPSIKNKLGY
jgi:hypothetical protein